MYSISTKIPEKKIGFLHGELYERGHYSLIQDLTKQLWDTIYMSEDMKSIDEITEQPGNTPWGFYKSYIIHIFIHPKASFDLSPQGLKKLKIFMEMIINNIFSGFNTDSRK